MATIVFLIVTSLLIWIQYKREQNLLNLISVLTVPYFFIVLFNNFIFYRFGFYEVEDEVLFMILGSLVSFFLGVCFITPKKIPLIYEEDNEIRFSQYDIGKMTFVITTIAVIGLLRVFNMYINGGFSGAQFDEAEGVASSGIIGHLMLLTSSLTPIVFLYWLDHKKKISCLIAVILIALLHFSTFVKYHVIGLIVSLFIFTVLYKKSVLLKGLTLLLSSVVMLFTGNYFIGFALRDLTVQSSFYANHFWTYAGGSLIYDRYVFNPGLNTQLSLGYKLMTFLMGLPNMFITKIFGREERLFPHIRKPDLIINIEGKTSNVTDAFGYLFPAKDSSIDVLFYFITIFLIGVLFSWIYIRAKQKSKYFSTFLVIFLTYFVFFNFFGTFYINAGPWEMLVYSLIIPNLFLRKTNLLKGKIHIS